MAEIDTVIEDDRWEAAGLEDLAARAGRRRVARPVEKGRQDIGEGDQIGIGDARASAGLADDQRQMEMEFGRQADLEVEAASENDVARVQDAVSDLERLEAEMSGSEANVSETGEKFGLG